MVAVGMREDGGEEWLEHETELYSDCEPYNVVTITMCYVEKSLILALTCQFSI